MVRIDSAKKSDLHTVMFFIFLSGVIFCCLIYEEFFRSSNFVTKAEIYASFFIFFIFLTIQFLSVKFYYNEEHKIYVRLLKVFLLIWFAFNTVFFFSRKLIPLAIIIFYPAFHVLFTRFMDFLGIKLRPIQNMAYWFFNQTGFLRKLRDYYSDNETLYLVFVGYFSLLSSFMIMGIYWSAAILTLFLVINIRTIVRFNPRKGLIRCFIYRKSLEGHPNAPSNPITFNFTEYILRPLNLFHCIGSGAFVTAFIYAYKWIKIPLPLQLAIWGACCWNLIMSEMYIYAVHVLEGINEDEKIALKK